ncbi:MAG TPA: hypothetical protein PKK26_13275 [Candidatus Wallbacteria bacterium]|nr:hypothetical protein [Candidatus Wallbacteria bacterium]
MIILSAFMNSTGCVSDKYDLGRNDAYYDVASIKAYRAGAEVKSLSNIKVGDHLILEGKAFNEKAETIPNTYVTATSTDEKIVKILTGYASNNSYFAVCRGEVIGSAEILLAAGNKTIAIPFGVGEGTVGETKPYIKFKNITSDALLVGTSREYIAEYVNEQSSTTETSLIWSLNPSTELTAKISSTTKTSATVTAIATGEVSLLVRDASNTAASGVVVTVR